MVMKRFISSLFYVCVCLFFTSACTSGSNPERGHKPLLKADSTGISVHILGTIQDGGSPHIGCDRQCCKALFDQPDASRKVVSLGIFDHKAGLRYLIEATPDLPSQLQLWRSKCGARFKSILPDAIFLTHAHIGHYTGLMYLGREALGAKDIPVFAMPGMKKFLETNGPWNQLVDLGNIRLIETKADSSIQMSPQLQIMPIRVPHRDEYSETVGFKIFGPNKRLLFIPDIDKWGLWERNIVEELKNVDYALIDATFFADGEINRPMAEVPHPFVEETMALLDHLPASEKKKVFFIHFNHTNPLLDSNSVAALKVGSLGFNIAQYGMEIKL